MVMVQRLNRDFLPQFPIVWTNNGEEPTMKLIRLNDVKAATGLARSTIYKYLKQGLFPAPVPLGGRSVAWVELEVQAWITERIRDRDQQMPVTAK